jgi:diguanylate cyclase (GGDEF)-like protein/PAS domain S-box-containing protein
MKLPRRALAVVAGTVLGGLLVLVSTVRGVGVDAAPTRQQIVVAVVVSALVAASWVRPLIVFAKGQSTAVSLDEAFFVLLLLVTGPGVAILSFAVATLVSQALKRRPLVKSGFNIGQVLLSAGAGAAVFTALSASVSPPSWRVIGAATTAGLAYFVVNDVAVGCIFAATGTTWREALFDAIDIRLLLAAAGITMGLVTALVLTAYTWALVLALLPLLILRQVLAGHFEARHDRARLNGLFESTLEIHGSMGREEVVGSLLEAAKSLLRCDAATLSDSAPEDGLSAPLRTLDHTTSLTVSGRSRTEPFDKADRSLLHALAAVGAGALTNARLYEEGTHQRERLAAITSSLGEGVCAVSRNGRITFMNPAASSMLGWDALAELQNLSIVPDSEPGLAAPSFILGPAMRSMTTGQSVISHDSRFERRDGSLIDVAFTVSPIIGEDAPSGAVLVFRDIRERKELEDQLTRNAFHDSLTGIPNRRLLLDHVDHALRRADHSEEHHAVLFADIDRFTIINDSLGHHAGDYLLIEVAGRIRESIRPGDMVARMGGDEFAVLLESISDANEAVLMAHRMLDSLREPFSLPDGHDVVATMSIGIAVSARGESRDDVLHNADVAMHRAKASPGGGQVEIFDVDVMGTRSAERIDLEAALRQALTRNEIEVYYQPHVDLSTECVVGAEALVRWHHPQRGLLAPTEFITLAEETGLILPLGHFVLEQACRQAKQWQDELDVTLTIGVNLSARQFQQAGLGQEVKDVLDLSGVSPSQLCLEITESLAMDDVNRTSDVLTGLKALGVKVAIDDFGTGHSALGYLARFPVDVVKIDRSFVDGVDSDPVKSAIVSAVINLSLAIGSTTVVEGIETAGQLKHLRDLGCTTAQGYYFARPGPAHALESMLIQTGKGLPLRSSQDCVSAPPGDARHAAANVTASA